jgi:teichuronic acid biosynthesis glycosyltransferase TuaG
MISVVIPNHNRSEYVAEAINSILNQTYKDIEIIVVDDCSTDSSMDILTWYGKKITLLRNNKNMGIAYTRNRGLKEAKGEYIAVMDSDDIASPDRLQKSLKAIKGVDFVYSHYLQANEDGRVFGGVEAPQTLDIANVLDGFTAPHVTIMAKRKCFEKYPYDNRLKVNDDLRLILEWVRQGYKYRVINEPLMIVRYHDTSVSKTRDAEVKKFTEELRREYA